MHDVKNVHPTHYKSHLCHEGKNDYEYKIHKDLTIKRHTLLFYFQKKNAQLCKRMNVCNIILF